MNYIVLGTCLRQRFHLPKIGVVNERYREDKSVTPLARRWEGATEEV